MKNNLRPNRLIWNDLSMDSNYSKEGKSESGILSRDVGDNFCDLQVNSEQYSLSSLEDLLYQEVNQNRFYDSDLRNELIIESFNYHVKNNSEYRKYVLSSPDIDLSCVNVDNIPLIPSSIFKKKLVVTPPIDGDLHKSTSSGTQGTKSIVARDRKTMHRFLGSIGYGIRNVIDDEVTKVRVFVLSPDIEEANDLWFSYVLGLIDLVYSSTFYVKNNVFLADKLISDLTSIESNHRPVVIGPPFLTKEFCERVISQSSPIDFSKNNGMVVTAGGWKRYDGKILNREDFFTLTNKALRIKSRSNVRDFFNMVELNTVIFECRNHKKHVPNWIRITARDPGSMAINPSGEEGVLCFCDALPTSYPGFLLSGDFGYVKYEHRCECGITSDVFDVTRRIKSIEARSCALKMDKGIKR